jgi:hypothetical protein
LLRIDHALHGPQCAGNESKEKSSPAYSEETFHCDQRAARSRVGKPEKRDGQFGAYFLSGRAQRE